LYLYWSNLDKTLWWWKRMWSSWWRI
jgi:hypothetical protein